MNMSDIFTPQNIILGGGFLATLSVAAGVWLFYKSTTSSSSVKDKHYAQIAFDFAGEGLKVLATYIGGQKPQHQSMLQIQQQQPQNNRSIGYYPFY